ncbi:MAG: aldo/keto reductase, partial [Trueperella pyogenes]|nr:aldo/keto reductase [Trueperella pyogenes]
MDIRHCGKYGLAVSSLGLGTLTWGRDTDEEQACAMLTAFVDAGGSLVEISPLHGSGRALSVLAQALKQVGRHRIVIALRGAMRFSQGSNEVSASRGDMLRCLDTTLAILDTDYVDLWLATPSSTPIPLEETLLALQWAYSSGRAHYVGLSHRDTWDCALAWAKSETLPLTAVEEEFSLVCSSPLL